MNAPHTGGRWLATLLPSANRVVEPVTSAVLLGQGVGALFTRVPKRGAVDPLPDRHDISALLQGAALLADAKPDGLVFSAGKGAAIGIHHDRDLIARIEGETGLRATTPALVLLEYCERHGIHRIVLAGPHDAAYNDRVRTGLHNSGLDTIAEVSLGLTDNLAFAAVPRETLANMIRHAAAVPGVQAVVAWNTNCLLPPIVADLERETGVTVLDATLLGLWGGLRMTSGRILPDATWGRLFSEGAS